MKIMAADIGGTSTKIGLCDESGRIERFQEYETESKRGGEHVIGKLMAHLEEYSGYDAIAVSTAGQVDADAGVIVYANENIPGYTGMRIADRLTERFGKPVRVENDVNSAALGEGRFGAGRSYADFLCLTYGTGIGGAIVINGDIYRGANGVAAEFGHILTHAWAERSDPEFKPYYEKFASTSALVHMARQVDPECINGRILFDKIDKGNEPLRRVVDDWITEVAAGLASIVHIFNPSAIVVGGGVMERDELVRQAEARTKEFIMDSFAGVRIVKASLGNKAGLLGAASRFLP
ncbi:ROK family protein [Paenibacillus dendritiformis]|uniref:ROK family protein n=1 Tax=Paenibacillus dendritiformis TaxID=130049 RepID=UPI000DA6F7D0|nr:ROK family protein [Paenibacillus dendritiformis]PZM62800.1 ROK family protein [Paenibacillus dendritiformis]